MKYILFLLLVIVGCRIFDEDKPEKEVTPRELANDWIHEQKTFGDNFDSSFVFWKSLKREYGDNYKYKFRRTSFDGFWKEHTITINNDTINDINVKYGDNFIVLDEDSNWIIPFTEETWPLDTLPDYFNTVDEGYVFCRDSVLSKDTINYSTYLEVHDNGLLKSCSYVPTGCFDDCSVGPVIDSLFFYSE